MAGTHAAALEAFLADNPRIDGLWTWTQDGGPWRAGPMSLYLREGNWGLYDLDVAATAALGWHTTQDPSAVAGGWMARTWSHDPATVEQVGRILDRSRTDVVLPGLYIGPYAEKQVFALGLEPPPMMWIFKWDIVSGDSAALSAVYLAARDDIDAAIESGRRAADVARELSDEFAAIDARTFHDPAAHESLAAALAYQADLMATLQSFREVFLRYYQWLDTGDSDARDAWAAALPLSATLLPRMRSDGTTTSTCRPTTSSPPTSPWPRPSAHRWCAGRRGPCSSSHWGLCCSCVRCVRAH